MQMGETETEGGRATVGMKWSRSVSLTLPMDNYQKKYKEISTSTQWNMMKENRSVASSWTQQVIFIMSEEQGVQQYVTLDHKPSLKSLGYICSNSQKYIVWVKIIVFFFYAKNH